MRVKKSTKVINGKNCFDVVKSKKVIKTFIGQAEAEAYVAEQRIGNYTKSKSYKNDLAFLNYMAGSNNLL